MSQQYWEDLYQKGDTRWDKGEASPGLADFLAGRPELPRGTVLIPGCGMGHDVRAWASHGFTALGMDLAPSAVQLSRERSADLMREGAPIDFQLGDFLGDEPRQPFDYVFEHTLFCAIQPAQRAAYVQAARRWLKPGGLYVAVFYLIPDTDGPPFGSTREEIHELFSPVFKLQEDWVPRSYANRKGLEWMTLWR